MYISFPESCPLVQKWTEWTDLVRVLGWPTFQNWPKVWGLMAVTVPPWYLLLYKLPWSWCLSITIEKLTMTLASLCFQFHKDAEVRIPGGMFLWLWSCLVPCLLHHNDVSLKLWARRSSCFLKLPLAEYSITAVRKANSHSLLLYLNRFNQLDPRNQENSIAISSSRLILYTALRGLEKDVAKKYGKTWCIPWRLQEKRKDACVM